MFGHPTVNRTGLELAQAYHREVVGPLLARLCPGMPYAAGRLGSGSEVLGLDDAVSRDHDWGLRLTLLVPEESRAEVGELLGRELPETFLGLPTSFAFSGEDEGRHRVEVDSPAGFARARLGVDPRDGMTSLDWLSLTGQAALEVVAGPVFVDTSGEITAIREALGWYPDDVWHHVVAADWARLAEEMPLMSRAGDRGDDLGSRVIAARLVDVTMHLGFLLERRWAPYPKWCGLLFGDLPHAAAVGEPLRAVLGAGTWQERQQHLAVALDALLELQRGAGLPGPSRSATAPFWDRPYLHPDPAIVPALLDRVADPALRALRPGLGSAEQRTHNVALLVDPAARRRLVGADR